MTSEVEAVQNGPVYFDGGPWDATIRSIPNADSFMVVELPDDGKPGPDEGTLGAYREDGRWGAFRRFAWHEDAMSVEP